MGYEIFTDHPETWTRRAEDFTSWLYWAEDEAPWTGVGIDKMAKIVQVVCKDPQADLICRILDLGGYLSPEAARTVLKVAERQMSGEVLTVFQRAVQGGYGIRVVFSKPLGDAVSASAYLAKFGSDSAH